MRINKWHVAGLFVALAIVSAIVVACQPRPQTPAAPTPTPTLIPPYLSVLPDQVLAGSVLAIIGADWQPGEEVTIGLVPTVPSPNVGTAILAIATANVQGRFEFTATLPANIVPGVWEVYAQTRTAGRFASDTLVVLQPTVAPPATAEPTAATTAAPQQPTRAATHPPQPSATPQPTRVVPPPTVLPSFPDWRGDYFANASLAGFPSVIRNDPVLNFDWGYGSPDPRIPPDFFSVRWTRNMFFEAGTYRFIFRVDDGMRIYVDNVLVLDAWVDGPPRDVSTDLTFGRGDRNFRIEYYERTGLAVIQFSLFRLPPGTPSPFPSSTPTQPPPPTWTPPPPLPTNTPIPIPTSLPTMIPPLPTNTPIVIPTAIPLPTASLTPVPVNTATSTALPTATSTSVPATATSTAIPVSTATSTVTPTATSTSTSTPTATATNAPAVATSTSTSTAIPLPSTSTATVTATPTTPAATSTSTSTPTTAPATATSTPTSTPTTAPATATSTATATPTTPAATSTSTSTPTTAPATATSTATATPTLEPTATSSPTTEPTATQTPTTEPTATETAEPTATATATTEPTATEASEPTVTPTPTTEPETPTPTATSPAVTVTPTQQITVTAVITGGVNLRVTGSGFTSGERLIISLADNPQGDNAVALNETTPYLVPRNGRLNFRTVLVEPPAGAVYAVVTNADGEVLKIVPVRIRQ